MAQSIEESLLEAIKKDDLYSFNHLIDNAQCGTYRLGRFPVLSLLYLYKSKKILSAHEEKLLKYTNFKAMREPVEVSKKFSGKAGKCLRLYINEVVSPLEMLLVLDRAKHLRQVFPKTKQSAAVRERLKSIYYIKYSLDVAFVGNDIIVARRPLSYREKKNIVTVCMCSFLAVAVAVCTPITVKSIMSNGNIFRLSQIDFSSDKQYTLKRDIVIPENYSVAKVNCKIVGGGNKLILGKGATLGELNGKISDTTIQTSGDAIFTVVSEKATLENVTVNVRADVTTTESSAFVSLLNYGTIDGVTVNVSGSVNALATSTENSSDIVFGGIVGLNGVRYNNYIGQIKNCTVNYSRFELVGELSANSSFGGVAGINGGYLNDCTVTGEINADTFDIGGVCYENSGLLSGCVNEANLSQSSDDSGWNPICSGIAITNVYAIDKCANKGNISAVGVGTACVGGICANSGTQISNCYSSGDIFVTAQEVYAGGILGASQFKIQGNLYIDCGAVANCISKSKLNINVTGDTPACVGGIVGCIREVQVNSANSVIYLGGAVTNSYFVGECVSAISYFGNIVGVCGANIFEGNSNYLVAAEYLHNFEGNLYSDNSYSAFGKTVTGDDNFASVEDKGATSATIDEIKNSEGYKSILNSLKFISDD